MQTKTTIRYHLTLIRMAIIKKSTNNKCWRKCEENICNENIMEVLQKTKIELPCDQKSYSWAYIQIKL